MGIQSPSGRLQCAHRLRPLPLRADHTREQHYRDTRQASSGPSGQRPTQPPRREGHLVPSPVLSKAVMSGGGGGGPSAGRAGPASGWSHIGLWPPSSRAAPCHPGQGQAALPQPAQQVQMLLVPQAGLGQQPYGPGTPLWSLAGGCCMVGHRAMPPALALRIPPRLTGPAAQCPWRPRRLHRAGPPSVPAALLCQGLPRPHPVLLSEGTRLQAPGLLRLVTPPPGVLRSFFKM